MSDNILAVGIDDGHDGIKVVYFDDKKQDFVCYRMPSVAQEGVGDMVAAPKGEVNNMMVSVTNENEVKHFLIDSERKVITNPLDTRFKEYPYSDLNIALIAQALKLAGVPYQKIFVTTGLPANQYFNKSSNSLNADLIKAKEDSIKRLHNVRHVSNPSMFYQIVGVATLPEGFGVSIDLNFDEEFKTTTYHEEVEETGFIVLDIGGRTVDLVKIMANGRPRPGDSYSFDSGMLFLRDMVRSRAADLIGQGNISDKMVDAIIKTGWHGKKDKMGSTDLTEVRDLTLRAFADRIYREIKGVLTSSDESMGGIIITGGGSHALGEYLKKSLVEGGFRYEIQIQEQPEFSNAKGFCKYSILKSKDLT